MVSLAITYLYLSRKEDALKLMEETFSFYKRIRPADHPETGNCMFNLVYAYHEIDRHLDAMSLS